MDDFDVGECGENYFRELCTKDRIRHHSPNKDVNGWDAHLEHPNMGPQASIFGAVKSYVQVKTTSPEYTRPRLSLSALMKLVDTDLPAFVVHLICRNEKIAKATIYHVDLNVMKFAIKKFRAKVAAGEKTNKYEYALKAKWGKPLAFGELNKHVIDAVLEQGSFAGYAMAKAINRQECSDDKEKMILKWGAAPQRPLYRPESFNDDLVVIRRYDTLSFSRSRFGIILPEEESQATDGILIKMRGHDGTSSLSFITGDRRTTFHGVRYYNEPWPTPAFHRRYSTFIFNFKFLHAYGSQEGFGWDIDFGCRFILPFPVIRKHMLAIKDLIENNGDLHVVVTDTDADGNKHEWKFRDKLVLNQDNVDTLSYLHTYLEFQNYLFENEYDTEEWKCTPYTLNQYFMANLPVLKSVLEREFSGALSDLTRDPPLVGEKFIRKGVLIFDGFELDLQTELTVAEFEVNDDGSFHVWGVDPTAEHWVFRKKEGRESFIPEEDDVRIPIPDISELKPWDYTDANFYD